MVRVKVWHTHTTVWLLKNYSQRILTYYTPTLLLVVKYVQYAYFIIGPNVRWHYDRHDLAVLQRHDTMQRVLRATNRRMFV